jgi:ABC-type nitrate/sulfonate/bicarbonate transport system substrate-binding protein
MKTANGLTRLAALAVLCLAAGGSSAQELFSKRVGEVKPGDVKPGVLEVPYILWGGDVATFLANGGKETKPDSIFGKMGLKLKLVDGDDFRAQVRNYVSGQSPFVRGTFSMLGQASEVLNNNAKTKPVVFLQMTWSAGDHMVARENCKTLNDLKGKKIALQEDGPHVGMLDDVLRTAGLKWKDITVVWTKDVTGKDGPSEKFRADNSIDACFVITPDMQGLTGGLEKKGTGAEKTVKGTHVLVSTVNMKRSIADLYAVRKDYFDANKATIEKFTAGYLKGCEELLAIKAAASKDKEAQAKYKAILKLTQEIYGKDKVASEEDADGLISDAVFVGLPGNRAFFKDKGNPSGFEAKQRHALDLAVGEKYAEARATFLPVEFNYKEIAKLGNLKTDIDQPPVPIPAKAELGEEIFTFVITFEPNQKEFPEAKYGNDFKKAVELASLFGNAVVTIRGHADPTKCLREFVTDGIAKRVLERKGTAGNYTYFLKGKQLNLDDRKTMSMVADLIRKEDFKEAAVTLKLCEKLSQDRADKVFESLVKYAGGQNLKLDKNQVKPVGVSILDPVVPKPKNNDEAAKNRRVEFRLYKIKGGAPAAEAGRFDY